MTDSLDSTQNIVLTGFMGTGKSTVGRILAERTGRDFVDMDAELEQRFGRSVARIFAEEGETAFREAESLLAQQLAHRANLVISSGGGALVNPANRKALAQSGLLVCLTATVDTILDRLDGHGDRPLLQGSREERRAQVTKLLADRRSTYAAIAHHVDTTGRTPDQVVDLVLAALHSDASFPGMSEVRVSHPAGDYPLLIAHGLLGSAGSLLVERSIGPAPIAVVTNPILAELYATMLLKSLRDADFEPHLLLVPEGEHFKSLATVATLYEQFVASELDRYSPVIALGGGVVGDLTGFASATWMRGVPFIQMPTTLLSMVDASVGGKTGVDLPQGKNLVGAFKQPEAVLMDTATLSTLPATEFRSGLAEVVKHAIIADPDLFAQLEHEGPPDVTHLVRQAVLVKVELVQIDPWESGPRALLNLGHTFGHALEQVSGYRMRHGEAVAVGMVAAARLATILGICAEGLPERIESLLTRLALPTRAPGYSLDDLYAAMWTDKKRSGSRLRFVLPRDLGDVVVTSEPTEAQVRDAWCYVLTPGQIQDEIRK
jgi:3-dehydroquinate synthase